MMLAQSKPYVYCLVDQASFRLVARTASAVQANALAQGLINTSPMTVYYPPQAQITPLLDRLAQDPEVNLTLVLKMNPTNQLTQGGYVVSDCNVCQIVKSTPTGRYLDFVPVEATAVSAEWQALRLLANRRSSAIDQLERRCDRYLTRTSSFSGDPIFLQYIGQQLTQGPDAPVFADWAEVNGSTRQAAYDELSMIWHSSGIAVTKIQALWSKYVRKINQLTEQTDLDRCVQVEFESEFRFGKRS